ncbi:hypothetical protein B0H10DRAFT_1975696 [Mycena sp. CBHHK59/15]|nr:hypothetical protein B0H10DRAFT_1975696 [Mycena sp. CBHHK59/15]
MQPSPTADRDVSACRNTGRLRSATSCMRCTQNGGKTIPRSGWSTGSRCRHRGE